MERQGSKTMLRQLPAALLATSAVVVLPALVSWVLRVKGVAVPVVGLVLLSAVMAVGSSYVGMRLWERHPRSGGRLFADLMLWGWARRWRLELRIAHVVSELGLDGAGAGPDTGGSASDRLDLLKQLVRDLEARDPYMHGHSGRVARYSSLVAARLGVHGHELGRVRLAAALHDLGKLRTPTAILHKPGRLTDEEYAVIKQHAATGARMIEATAQDADLATVVRHHHERLDGTGYPDGLAGDSIPLASRIIAVADTFDALTADRPYRSARPHKVALDILRAEAGTQLDGDVVAAFVSVYASRWQVGFAAAAFATGGRSLSGLLSGAPAAAMSVAGAAAVGAVAGLAPAALVRAPAPVETRAGRAPAGSASAPLRAGPYPVRPRNSGNRAQAPTRPGPRRASSERVHSAAESGARDTGSRTSKPAATGGPTGAPSTPTTAATSPAASATSTPTSSTPARSRPTVSASGHGSGSGASATVKVGAPGTTATIGGTLNHNGGSVHVGASAGPISTTVSVPLPPLPRPPAVTTPHLPLPASK